MYYSSFRQDFSQMSHSHRRSMYYHPQHNHMSYLARSNDPHSASAVSEARKSDDRFEDAADDNDGISFVNFMRYLKMKDTSFYAKPKIRHKIMDRKAYFPEEYEEEKDVDGIEVAAYPLSCSSSHFHYAKSGALGDQRTVQSDSTYATKPEVELASFRSSSPVSTALASNAIANSASTGSHAFRPQEGSIDNDLGERPSSKTAETLSKLSVDLEVSTTNSYKSSFGRSSVDRKPSSLPGETVIRSINGATINKFPMDNQLDTTPDSRLMTIEVESLSMLIKAKLLVSRRSRFVIWLKEIDVDLANTIALHPRQFVLCMETVDFLCDQKVMAIFNSIGMKFTALNMLDVTNRCFKLVWILSFADKRFTAATSDQFFNSTDELENEVAKHFRKSRNPDLVNIFRTFRRPCDRCTNL